MVGLSAVAVAAPASAASTQNMYMTKGVDNVDGVYYGDFVTLAKTGSKVVGAVGAFNSEYACFSGAVKSGWLRATIYDNGQAVATFKRKWVGSGKTARIKGMTRVSRATVTTYLDGGDPRAFIKDCRSMVP